MRYVENKWSESFSKYVLNHLEHPINNLDYPSNHLAMP